MRIILGKWWILGATFGATEAKQRGNNVMTLETFVSERMSEGEMLAGSPWLRWLGIVVMSLAISLCHGQMLRRCGIKSLDCWRAIFAIAICRRSSRPKPYAASAQRE